MHKQDTQTTLTLWISNQDTFATKTPKLHAYIINIKRKDTFA